MKPLERNSDERLAALIRLGREDRSLEYKQSAPWEDLKVKITRTAMGMANVRDGGTIVLGVAQDGNRWLLEGMNKADLETYDEDDIRAFVNAYADPYVNLEVRVFLLDTKEFVVINVGQFAELPVVCKKDHGKDIRLGAIYTRSYRMPETSEVRSQTEMREIIDLAIDVGVR